MFPSPVFSEHPSLGLTDGLICYGVLHKHVDEPLQRELGTQISMFAAFTPHPPPKAEPCSIEYESITFLLFWRYSVVYINVLT